jgi:MoaA/NifB/PqqE/SkfB family radical SAM enzyme
MAVPYTTIKTAPSMLRLPLEGSIDLTYRCNNVCRHCWLWLAENASERADELTFNEIKGIVDSARAMGARTWHISGGEPMLRDDFSDIFDYITRKATAYSLNTNGTLITPAIAQLLKQRKGNKMIAIYGATAETYDRVTRNPGGFEQVMRGFRYMQEADAGFTVQLIPMRDNWHEWEQMQELAQSLSPHWRVGAPWLYKSASGSSTSNVEIERQRLDPRTAVELDKPDMSYESVGGKCQQCVDGGGDRLLAACSEHNIFHIDPYGGMTVCSSLKDPAVRYNLRKGTFREAWDVFIPSLADKVRGGSEYFEHCGTCDLRADCRWCPAYSYLEHGRHSAPIEYLCAVAHENRAFKENWKMNHRRYYQIGGITIQVDSDLPITDTTFSSQLDLFRVDGPSDDMVTLCHHFELPDLTGQDFGKEVYRKTPWAIYRQGDAWVYLGIAPQPGESTEPDAIAALDRERMRAQAGDKVVTHMLSERRNHDQHAQAGDSNVWKVASFNHDHTRAQIYNNLDEYYLKGNNNSLALFPSDQILVARLLADRNGCYLHSAGAILNGAGILFVGHSSAGKSTTTKMLMDAAGNLDFQSLQVEILCDDRNIVRRWDDGWRVYGTWSHGDIPDVSPTSAPLRAICFIEQAEENTLTPLTDRKEIMRRLLACVIKPLVTTDWWDKTLTILEQLAHEAPCYVMRFDKSGKIVVELQKLTEKF